MVLRSVHSASIDLTFSNLWEVSFYVEVLLYCNHELAKNSRCSESGLKCAHYTLFDKQQTLPAFQTSQRGTFGQRHLEVVNNYFFESEPRTTSLVPFRCTVQVECKEKIPTGSKAFYGRCRASPNEHARSLSSFSEDGSNLGYRAPNTNVSCSTRVAQNAENGHQGANEMRIRHRN